MKSGNQESGGLPQQLRGSTASSLATEEVEHEYKNTTSDVFRVVKCRDCSLVYLNPRPDISELPTIYPSEYYAYHLSREECREGKHCFTSTKLARHVYMSRLSVLFSLHGKRQLASSRHRLGPTGAPSIGISRGEKCRC